jgi:hypothetical protein
VGENGYGQKYKSANKIQLHEHLCDQQILLGLTCILPMLESMHVFIKFAQMQDIFVCDLVATIKVCQGDFYNMYYD